MPNIMIVSKTRMTKHVCVGGFVLGSRQNIRLLTEGGSNQPIECSFQIGDLWDISYTSKSNCIPPHIEDVHVLKAKKYSVQPQLERFIRSNCQIVDGNISLTFDGRLQYTNNGSAYIAHGTGIPHDSVCFWSTDTPLFRNDYGDKVRYQYKEGSAVRRITYVGFQNSPNQIRSGTLLRLSLARWWKPDDASDAEPKKCFLQLSGYYSN